MGGRVDESGTKKEDPSRRFVIRLKGFSSTLSRRDLCNASANSE